MLDVVLVKDSEGVERARGILARNLVTGKKISPVFDKTLALFGKETVLANIESGLAML